MDPAVSLSPARASALSPDSLSLALLQRYAGPCPRYTSYPTADRFAPLDGETGDASGRKPWTSLGDAGSLSLYVHIPFCQSLCYFCACNKVITRKYDGAADYLETLLREARWYRGLSRAPVTQLHLGGGTPTFLNDSDLERLINGLREHFSLQSGEEVEYSIEADPRTLAPGTLKTLRRLGFNRLSLGVQDFDPGVQRAINRICSAGEVAALTDDARAQGFGSIAYDLIYGLPGQTVDSLQRTVEQVLALAPDRIALYHYAHLPERFRAQRLINANLMPAPVDKMAMQLAATRQLTGAGYQFLGMDHFARPGDAMAKAAMEGRLARNFQGYTLMPAEALVGLGASAISYSRDGYWQNAHALKAYAGAVADRGQAIVRGWYMSEDDRLRQWLIMELMCQLGVDKREVEARAGAPFEDFFDAELKRLQPMFDDDLVRLDQREFYVTEQGRWFLRNLAAAFDTHLHRAVENGPYSRVL